MTKQNNPNSKAYQRKLSKKHKEALESICKDPSLININPRTISKVEIEVSFYGVCGQQLGAADVVIYKKEDSKIYVVEYKCNDSKNNREKVEKQLAFANYGFELEDLITEELFYVHGNFNVETLNKKGFQPFFGYDE